MGNQVERTVSEAIPKYKPAESGLPFEEGRLYTYADYCAWPDQINGRFVQYELIDGVPAIMYAPKWEHQAVSGELFRQIANFLKGKPCKVFAAPFDVRLNAEGADDTVLQPDIIVICDKSVAGSNYAGLRGTGCKGAPDMVVEVISPGTEKRDRLEKLRQYEKYGVREYWIVDPETKITAVHISDNSKYYIKPYGSIDKVPVYVLEGCVIDMNEVFAGAD